MSSFKFKLKQNLNIKVSGEEGRVVARIDYANGDESQYQIQYRAADGKATVSWWDESALESTE